MDTVKQNGAGKVGNKANASRGALDAILQRLNMLEARLARLESAVGIAALPLRASNADEFAGTERTLGAGSTSIATDATQPTDAASPKSSSTIAIGTEPKSYSLTATAPATERLRPLSAISTSIEASFPDLSMLDEKVDIKKPPAQHVAVKAAIEDYPRIASRIQQLWGTPECEGYITNLIVDTRGDRKGFPPQVMEELLYLTRLARGLVILAIDADRWDAYDQVGDRR